MSQTTRPDIVLGRDAAPGTDTVLGKAVALLRSFGVDDHVLSLAQLVRRTGLHKATAHRLANELAAHRLLDKVDGGYRLSGGLFELGLRASAERSILELATPFLQDLLERTQETVHLGIPDGDEVVYIGKIGGHHQVPAPSRIGGRMPLHCTAIGKVLLAHADDELRRRVLAQPLRPRTAHTVIAPGLLSRQLEAVAAAGVAFEREESTLGLLCVAAPVLDMDRRPVAAISVTGPVGRFRPESHVAAVRAAATGVAGLVARRHAMG